MKIIGVIPARYGAKRFPGKPLAFIAGKFLIQRVIEQCQQARSLAEIIVATDDRRIADVAARFASVEMTSPDHPSGTDRVAEVVRRRPCDAVVNLQGDEPLMPPAAIDAVAQALHHAEMTTAATPLRELADYDNPNAVKVVINSRGRALYFSRRTLPYLRADAHRPVAEQMLAFPFLKHLGIYGYRRDTLLRLVDSPVSPLEAAEQLEQLRALEMEIPIHVSTVEYAGASVDVPEDIAVVEARLKQAAA